MIVYTVYTVYTVSLNDCYFRYTTNNAIATPRMSLYKSPLFYTTDKSSLFYTTDKSPLFYTTPPLIKVLYISISLVKKDTYKPDRAIQAKQSDV